MTIIVQQLFLSKVFPKFDSYCIVSIYFNYCFVNYQFKSYAYFSDIASGASDDYAKADRHIKYAYTVELPDDGLYGFLLPSRLIPKTSEETFVGLKAFTKGLAKKTRRERNKRAKRQKRRLRRS